MDTPSEDITRRRFFERGAKATAGAALAPSLSTPAQAKDPNDRGSGDSAPVRVALVGTGNRGTSTWGEDLVNQFPERIEMVGLCDINPGRVKTGRELIGVDAPTYVASDFERMIEETSPDTVIVATTDCYHVQYAVRAMKAGCDVLSEKPLATEAEQCQRLLEAEQETGQNVKVGFNARHGRSAEEAKKILESGVLGEIISAEFEEYLNVDHGASYFRRWHGLSRYSGTLLVHKASHHFDQMNWWLGADPKTVNAFGDVAFYGSNNPFQGEKCRGCEFQGECDFYWDITDIERYMKLYVQNEDIDGYIRDDCVWDRDIDTYDTMTAEVEYENGVRLSYSLNAFMPYEGQRIAFNGENGRLDIRNYSDQPWDVPYEADFRLTKNFGETKTWQVGKEGEVDLGQGGHGGSDAKLRRLIFMDDEPDPLDQLAGSRAGVMASLIGIAARRSIETGQQMRVEDLIDVPAGWDYWTES
jgi:predicted dehydrogenase